VQFPHQINSLAALMTGEVTDSGHRLGGGGAFNRDKDLPSWHKACMTTPHHPFL
jgi:hypothetical protein